MPRRSRAIRSNRTTNYNWSGIVDTQNAIAAGTKVLLSTFALSNPNIDETILRTVGMIAVRSDQVIATEEQIGVFGITVVSDAAIAVGATAIPGPVSDVDDDDWAVWIPFSNGFQFVSAAGFESQAVTQRYFDFKSKRVIQEGKTLAVMVEAATGGSGFEFDAIFRMLSMVRGT